MTASGDTPSVTHPDEPATDKQRSWLIGHGVDPSAVNDPRLTRGKASEWIDGVKAGTPPGQQTLPSAAASQEPEAERPMAQVAAGASTIATAAAASRALSPEPGDPVELVRATEIISPYLIRPEIDIKQAITIWEAFKAFREHILKDEACYDIIEGSKEMNRTGATRLAVPFGLSIEERSREEKTFDDGDVRYISRIRVSKGPRYIEGIGTARLSEIPAKTKKGTPVPLGQREHFGFTRAWTRGAKRAIADMLGGTEAD